MFENPCIRDWTVLYYNPAKKFEREDRPLTECEQIILPENQDIAIWYVPTDKGSGFDFFVGAFTSCSGDTPEPLMTHPDTEVECLLHGAAFYDGVRHLHFGHERSNNVGYLYYIDPRDLAAVFRVLARLERQFCSGIDHRRDEEVGTC